MRGGETSGAALAGVDAVGGGEEWEVYNPEEVEAWVGFDEIGGDGRFVDMVTQPAEWCGASGKLDVPGTGLEDYEIAFL